MTREINDSLHCSHATDLHNKFNLFSLWLTYRCRTYGDPTVFLQYHEFSLQLSHHNWLPFRRLPGVWCRLVPRTSSRSVWSLRKEGLLYLDNVYLSLTRHNNYAVKLR